MRLSTLVIAPVLALAIGLGGCGTTNRSAVPADSTAIISCEAARISMEARTDPQGEPDFAADRVGSPF